MLYALAHFLRDHCPFIWDLVDVLNSFLFSLRYGNKLKKIKEVLTRVDSPYAILPLSECQASDLAAFFDAQPQEAFDYFRPHGFDEKSLKKLQSYSAFLAYVVKDNEKIVGYFFMRSFFHGKTFIGRIVDYSYRGKGIAKMMNRVTFEIAQLIGLRVFQTISTKNISSLRSAQAENELRIIETLPNGDLYVENLPKKKT